MDTKDITSTHVGNTEIQRIICGGGILWERFAEWEKWSVKEVRRLDKKLIRENTILSSFSWVRFHKDYSYNYGLSYPRFLFKGTESGVDFAFVASDVFRYAKVDSSRNLSSSDTGSYPYMLETTESWDNNGNSAKARGNLYEAIEIKNKRKDKLIETVSAPEGTYPDNGVQGDYWYVKKG